jgi:prepilin-type N-terminal cleavage/methylation domain-containing protein
MYKHNQNKQYGFSIIEVLVVIVVIAVLATLTNNYLTNTGTKESPTSQANTVSMKFDLNSIATQLKIAQVESATESYPTELESVSGLKTIIAKEDVTFKYLVDNKADPSTFCVAATSYNTTYHITNYSQAEEGNCP